MKKLTFVLSILLSVTMFSCSENEEPDEPFEKEEDTEAKKDENKAMTDLLASVEDLTDKYLNCRQFLPSRSTNAGLIDTSTVIADADSKPLIECFLGRRVGIGKALMEGIRNSLEAAGRTDQLSQVTAIRRISSCPGFTFTSAPLNDVVYNNANPTELDSIGYWHNKIIIDWYNANRAKLYTDYIEGDSILYDICGFYAAEKGLLQDDIYSSVTSDPDYSDMKILISNVIQNHGMSEELHQALCLRPNSNVGCLQFVKNYIDAIVVMEEGQISKYNQGVLEAIEQSIITDDMKDALKASVLVANASVKLWNEYLEYFRAH